MHSVKSAPSSKDKPFWRKNTETVPGNIKPVYGAQHPPIHHSLISSTVQPGESEGEASAVLASSPVGGAGKMSKAKRGSSFTDFQRQTSDAWELGEDDEKLMVLSPQDVHTAAMAVIHHHKQKQNQSINQSAATDLDVAATEDDCPALDHLHMLDAGLERVTSRSPGIAVRQTATNFPISKQSAYQQLNELPDREIVKLDKFRQLLSSTCELEELRQLSWSGIPKDVRPNTWKLLSGYLPPNVDRRLPTLERKRSEYFGFVSRYYDTRHEEQHKDTYRQIHIDIPRMNPLISLFQQEVVQEIFQRILYIWAIRHPASGYVQGINDLVTPFFVVFLSEFIDPEVNVENFDVTQLPEDTLKQIEADSYWCTSRLLDGIQDNYTFAQPGIQIKVGQMKDLVKRIDDNLSKQLETFSVEYLQFAFRWMNNLLMREIPLRCTIRLWDTYLSETDGFASFHLYVCTAFLVHWSKDIKREKDFQGVMLLLQNLPTAHWGNEEIGLLLAEAFKLKYMFADAPNHLNKIK